MYLIFFYGTTSQQSTKSLRWAKIQAKLQVLDRKGILLDLHIFNTKTSVLQFHCAQTAKPLKASFFCYSLDFTFHKDRPKLTNWKRTYYDILRLHTSGKCKVKRHYHNHMDSACVSNNLTNPAFTKVTKPLCNRLQIHFTNQIKAFSSSFWQRHHEFRNI